MRLSDKPLTQIEVESAWISDRSRLISCADRHAALVEFYNDRDGRIIGK